MLVSRNKEKDARNRTLPKKLQVKCSIDMH